MKINKGKIIILILSASIGVLISTIMKSNLESYAPVTIASLQVMQEEIRVLNEEVNDFKRIYDGKEEELESLKDIYYTDSTIVDKLNIDLASSKTMSGNQALEGPGITIKMYDNPSEEIIGANVNDDVIHDVDMLNIINDLRVAGAEAISINGERVVTSSEMKCGGPIIRINGTSIGTPFIVSAIGDPQLLMAAVNAPGTYGDFLKNTYHIGFEPKEEDDLFIPAYSGKFSFKYAKPKGEGDE